VSWYQKKHSLTHTFHGQFVICRLGLAMINLHVKFEVSIFTHYEDIKNNTKCINWGGLVVMGRPMSPAMSPFDRVHTTFTFNKNFASVLYCFRVITSCLSKVTYCNLPHLHLAPPVGVTPFEFCQELWHQKTIESLGYHLALFCMIVLLAIGRQYRHVTDTTAYTVLA